MRQAGPCQRVIATSGVPLSWPMPLRSRLRTISVVVPWPSHAVVLEADFGFRIYSRVSRDQLLTHTYHDSTPPGPAHGDSSLSRFERSSDIIDH